MKEPKIISEGCTDEELYEWMRKKAMNANFLQEALARKAYLEQALKDVGLEIEQLTSKAALDVTPQ